MEKLTIKEAEDHISEIESNFYDIDICNSLKSALYYKFILSVSLGLYPDQNEMQVVAKTVLLAFDVDC